MLYSSSVPIAIYSDFNVAVAQLGTRHFKRDQPVRSSQCADSVRQSKPPFRGGLYKLGPVPVSIRPDWRYQEWRRISRGDLLLGSRPRL